MTQYFLLMGHFAKYGFLCFGGGYMLIPFIIDDFVGEGKLFSPDEFGNLVSIAQVTPGPVGINTATYVGTIQAGVTGAVFATIGLVLPSLLLCTTVVKSINRWKDTFAVSGMLRGARIGALGMIFYAVTIFLGMSVFTAPIPWRWLAGYFTGSAPVHPDGFGLSFAGLFICALSVVLMLKTKISVTMLIIGSAVLGAALAVF